ncbi:MAG: SH3 domain-containing protein [Deltaproteobacteria bacterium]|nr:SH3 domain-containing protein [Deltaproteobacteria bacterium]MBW2202579.1 SH3 domain-containing protein [Deltaproteobacteria bacterium]
MKTRHILGVLMAFLCLSFSIVFARESQWVASEGAKLKTDHKASSDTIAKLPIGTEVLVLDSEKRWRYIRTPSQQEGWIYRGRLSDSPPEKEAKGTEDLFGSLAGSGISADEADTGRSIRGLSRETEEYAKKTGTPVSYQKALDRVLAMRVSEKELVVFLKKGKIGEYAP